jgi:hypothetical protein
LTLVDIPLEISHRLNEGDAATATRWQHRPMGLSRLAHDAP